MKAYLFDDIQVEIDPHAVQLGGSWQGMRRNNLPTAWDGDLLRFFYEQLKPGYRFLDIGASTGSYPLLCGLRHDVMCIAFEPNPTAREILEANVKLNNLDYYVIVIPFALSDVTGRATLQLPPNDAAGLATLAEAPTRFEPIKAIPVIARRLDGLNVGPINMIKIDVEGAELMVLRGAVETLTRNHPALLIEYDERNTAAFGCKPIEIINFLKELGYHNFEHFEADIWAT